MRICVSLLAVAALALAAEPANPCKRQPFRGRCPSTNGEAPKRSQFVLRYYMRGGECVSYPFGHCANDPEEPKLYRYKEECEDACISNAPANLGSAKDGVPEATYATPKTADKRVEGDQPSTTTTAAPRTECERRRLHASSSSIRGSFVPTCTPTGDFERVQCEPNQQQCFCVDSHGIELPNSRTHNGQRPDCSSIQSAPRSTVKECVGEASRGPCQSTLNRWFYEESTQTCKSFDYSGCGGNGNNYESKESCESRCAPPPRGLPKCEIGEPLKTKIGVPVNCAKTDCPSGYKCNIVQQSSVCCQESSKDVGLQTVDDRCKLPKERGPCDKYELRFYYNPDLHECKYFFWGGCDGNTNNFEKAEDCEVACGVRKQGVSKTVEEHPGRGQQHVGFRTTQGIRITPHMLTTTPSTDNASTTASPEEATSTTVKEERRPTTTTTRRTSPTTTTSTTTAKTTTSAPRTTTRTRPSVPLPSRPRTAPVVAEDSEEEAQDVRVVVPNQVLIGGTEAPDSVNRCKHPKDSGNCRGQFVRWYFDDATQLCDVFTYTGCQGNGNNFASREECQAICAKPPSTAAPLPDFSNICNNDVDAGECNGVFQRFAFDTEAGDCRPFTYGGCGGNGNNFATIAECRQRCTKTPEVPPNACDTDIEVGECSGVFHRFAFDKNINDCRQFTYGGCGGNGNNFASMQECRNKCVNRICPEPPACDLLRCQLVNDRSGCPFCSCPPVRQPSPPASTACQPVQNCADPCIVISNRKGCEECVCPSPEVENGVVPPSPLPTVHLPPTTQTTRVARPPATHVARPPASFEDVGPPSRPIAPPAATNAPPRQHAVPTVESFEEKPIELPVRPSLPNLPTLLSAQLEEKCMQAVEPGPCKNFADRWYFNSEDGTCHPFKYGGCAGNRNHFFTQKECEVHCARFLSGASKPPLHVHEVNTREHESTLRHVEEAASDVEEAAGDVEVPRTVLSAVPRTVLSAVPQRVHAAPTLRQHAPLQQPFAIAPNTQPAPALFQDSSNFQRSPSNSLDTVAPVAARPRQFSAPKLNRAKGDDGYGMPPIDQYNPQTNTNLAGLSPPVHPTYFTYNSQNQGLRKQFAVNQANFEDKSPVQLPRNNFDPLRNRQAPQSIPTIQPQPQPKFGRQSVPPQTTPTPVQNQRVDFNTQRQSAQFVHKAPLPDRDRELLTRQPVRTFENFEALKISLQNSPQQRQVQRPVQNFEEPRANSFQVRSQPNVAFTRPPQEQFNRNAEVLRIVKNEAQSRQPFLERTPEPSRNSNLGNARSEPTRNSEVEKRPNNLLRNVEEPRNFRPRQQENSFSQQRGRIEFPTETTTASRFVPRRPEPTSTTQRPTEAWWQKTDTPWWLRNPQNPSTAVTKKAWQAPPQAFTTEAPVPKKISSSFELRSSENDFKPKSLPELKIKKIIKQPVLESTTRVWTTSTTTQRPTTTQPLKQRNPAESSPFINFDRKQYIYYNGDFYGPTIPGIRINSTNGQVIDESHGQEDVAAAFRSFQTQLQGFRANVDRFVSAAKTSKTTSPEVPSDKTENLKKASVQTPKVRTPNIHPSKLSELDERAFRHQLKHTSLLLSNNSRRPESRSNSHVISNNPSQHGVSNYFNQNKSILASSTSIAGISDEEEEEELTSEEFEQPSQGRRTFGAVASGVPLHTATHRVENYNSPNPPLREAAAGPILGKKHLEVLPIAGLDAISAAHPPAPELQTTLVPRIPTQSRSLLSVISPPVHHNPNRIITGFVPSSSTTSTTGAPSSTTPATTTSTSIYRTSTTAEDVLEEENETTVVNEVESMPEDDFSREQVIKDVEESEASQKVLFGTAPHASTPNSEFAEEINGSGSELEREEEKEETSNIVPALPPSDPINEYKRINIQPIPNREEEPSETEDSVTAEVTEEKKVSEFSNVSSEEHEDPKASTIEHVFPSSTSTEPSTQPSTTAEATTVSTKAIPTEPSRFAFSSDEDENTELIDVVPEHSHVSSSHTFEVEKPSHIVQTSELDENFKSVEDVSKNAIGRAPEPVDVNSFAMPPRVSPPSTLGTTPSTAAPKTTTSENLVVPAVTPSFEPKFDGRIVCAMPPDAGTCSNYVQRWFFNSQTGQCEQFSFGSCGGNPNNFPDRNICERKCIPHHVILSQVPDRCAIDKDAGFGKGYNVKWYFNMKNLRCEQFVFEGLGGNANQFETLSECERLCTPSSPNNQKTQPTTTTAEPIESEEEDDYSLERLGVESPENGVAPLSSIHRAIVANIDQGIELPPLLIPSEATSTASPSTTTTAATTTRPVPPAVTTTSSAPTTAAPTTAAATTTAAAPQPTTPELLLAPLAPTPDNLPVLPPLLAPTPDTLPVLPPAPEPRPPAAQASKTITEEQIRKESKSYPAESVVGREKFPTANDGQPIVGMSPKETVNYQTGEVNHRASGIRTFPADEGKAINIDADLRKKESSNMPACANGRQEIRYADGRPVMCLPGKNQCPDGSSCYFNGIDFTCCPNEEDPYDKHAFGGYDGEEAKQGYKVFGPLRIRRLMDEVPLRQRRNAEFSLDSVVAPLRFDAEKPHTVSRAQRMRSQPEPRHNANSLCLQPLVRGSCQETHVRYYYDMSSDSCRLFEYSGCDGNANNFGSLQDCQRLCILDIQKIGGSVPTIASTTETPAEPEETLAPGQCPGGRAPLGGSSPVLCGNTTDSIGCPSSYYCRRGPPDVCCPGVDPKLEKPEDIVTDANRGIVTSESNLPRGFNRKVFLSTPKYMCPDAADPLMMENNEPLPCGSGFDGLKMCPKGYYCAIDVEKSSRLCCPMFGDAQRIASEEIFAHRLSLSDSTTTTTTSPFEASEMEEDEDEEEEEGPLAHLQMKPMSPQRDQLQKLAETSPVAPEVEAENVSIDLGGAKETPSEEVTTTTQKAVLDKSICQIKPSEGRVCRDDEKPSRTNLQYFYSPRDRRCKLFFFRGCGGNENRFEKKSDCEALCLV